MHTDEGVALAYIFTKVMVPDFTLTEGNDVISAVQKFL